MLLLLFSGVTSGVSGTVAYTNNNDTSAASGTTTVTGTVARTNANDTSAAAGSTTIVGTSATTNANDTSNASGSVGGAVSGTVAYTNNNDTSNAAGNTPVVVDATRNSAGYPPIAAFQNRGETEEQKYKRRVAQGFFPGKKLPGKPEKALETEYQAPIDLAGDIAAQERLEAQLTGLMERRQTAARSAEIEALLIQVEAHRAAIEAEELDIAFIAMMMLSES